MEMTLLDIVRRAPVPAPWGEGDNIPWSDPGFSERMLQEHLSQRHDAASRRAETIDVHVAWIHESVLSGHISEILDLGCGPGLYTTRLSSLGHHCTGIDYSPASVNYANRSSEVEHRLEDVRTADFGVDNDLVMMIYGELNVFRPSEAAAILSRARHSLKADGRLLLEAHTPEAIEAMGNNPPSWRSSEGGLFSDRPHILLEESFWNGEQRASTIRYFVIDTETGAISRFAQSLQRYSLTEYEAALNGTGFTLELVAPSLTGTSDTGDFVVLVARAA